MSAPRTVGPVTTATALGGVSGLTISAAVIAIAVHFWPEIEPIRDPLSFLLGTVLSGGAAFLGGYLVPSDRNAAAEGEVEHAPEYPVGPSI